MAMQKSVAGKTATAPTVHGIYTNMTCMYTVVYLISICTHAAYFLEELELPSNKIDPPLQYVGLKWLK